VRFIPWDQHYKLGLNKRMYCWRPLHCIFVDFAVRVDKKSETKERSNFQLLKTDESSRLIIHDWIANIDKLQKGAVWDGCVCECFWNPQGKTFVPAEGKVVEYKGAWELHRIRTDRLDPNPQWIVTKLTEEIERNLTLADVLRYFGQSLIISPIDQRKPRKAKKKATRK
jgi:hypothetical protein